MSTLVIVRGAFGGGWEWTPVADLLRQSGHRLFTPTLTGMGERSHLGAAVGLHTHVDDVVAVLDFEDCGASSSAERAKAAWPPPVPPIAFQIGSHRGSTSTLWCRAAASPGSTFSPGSWHRLCEEPPRRQTSGWCRSAGDPAPGGHNRRTPT
jgi:hypothetical protein